jgi:methyl-accepting chemotaxis protein
LFKALFRPGRPARSIPSDLVLDRLSGNVMLSDKDLVITYVNPALTSMLVGIEQDLRKELPHFDARQLIGRNIDIFHKNPSHQRAMLANLHGRHQTDIVVGGRHLSLTVVALDGPDGERLGYCVEWLDRTVQH